MAVPSKQYGLILPKNKAASNIAALQRPSVFGDDSDDETSVGESLQKEAVKKKMMKQTRLEMQKALEEDSTVYDYDAVYDEIQKQRVESSKKVLGGTDRKPKYINQLLKAVEERKKEQERRDERKIQKEREAEGEQFADKEAYVTSAYRQKLQERKEEEERERRVAEMEAALDVTKQKDLSSFYRHLLNQTVGEEAIPDHSADTTQSSKVSKVAEKTSPSPPPSPASHDDIPNSYSDTEEGQDQKSGFSKPGPGSNHAKCQYTGREEDRSRARGDMEREERHSKRERSPWERERGKNGEREKRRGQDEDKLKEEGRNKEKDRRRDEKERRRDEEKEGRDEEKAAKREGKDEKRKEGVVGEETKEKQGEVSVKQEEKANKFAKRSSDQTVSSARDRYLA